MGRHWVIWFYIPLFRGNVVIKWILGEKLAYFDKIWQYD